MLVHSITQPLLESAWLTVGSFKRLPYLLLFGSLFFTVYSLLSESRKLEKNFINHSLATLLFFLIAYYLGTRSSHTELLVTTSLISSSLLLILLALRRSLCCYLPLAGLVTIILYGLFCYTAYSITSLFHVTSYSNIYLDLGLLSFSLLFPLLILISLTFPEETEIPFSNFIFLLITYLMIPLLLLYQSVLWIYLIKILVTWKIPSNLITQLTLVCGGLGAAIYLISESIRRPSWLIEWFSRNYFRCLPPSLLASTFSLMLRVHQYGFTPIHYLDLLTLIGFTITVLYAYLRPNSSLSNFLLLTIASLLLMASFGPWGITALIH